MVTLTGGRPPGPRAVTTSAGTSMPVAVLPPSSTVALNLMTSRVRQTRSARYGSDDRRGEPRRGLQRREVADTVEAGQLGDGEELADTVRPLAGEQRIVFRPQDRHGHRDPAIVGGGLLRQRRGDRSRPRPVPGDRGGERARRAVDRDQVA